MIIEDLLLPGSPMVMHPKNKPSKLGKSLKAEAIDLNHLSYLPTYIDHKIAHQPPSILYG